MVLLKRVWESDLPPHTQGLNVTTTSNTHLIVSARLISDFGAFLNMVALATYVYLLTDSAIWAHCWR